MNAIATIRRNLALKEMDIKESPDGRPVFFSVKFVKKNGELVFVPKATSAGLRFDMKTNMMRGILPVDSNGHPAGHVTPVHIDGFIEYNGKKIRL